MTEKMPIWRIVEQMKHAISQMDGVQRRDFQDEFEKHGGKSQGIINALLGQIEPNLEDQKAPQEIVPHVIDLEEIANRQKAAEESIRQKFAKI